MAFITLAFSAQGNKAIAEPTVVPVPTMAQIAAPTPTAIPDHGIQQTQYGYVITYPEPVKSYDVNVNVNPSYVAPASATPKPTATPTSKPRRPPGPGNR
jgi:hypothetical protein